jgi:serine/threonine protein phosphatase PrpC
MRSAWKSDPGLIRENNEDFVLADEERGIFLLADGMGGGPGGEVASNLAAKTAHQALTRFLREQRPEEEIPRLMAEALAAAHSAVFKRTLAEPSLSGMGTTLDMTVVRERRVYICHVGDGRIYHFRRAKLHQVTIDDNYAAFLAASGQIPVDRIPRAYRHILTQAVGPSKELIPEIRALEMEPSDLLLMCSDGLTGVVNDLEIGRIMDESRSNLAAMADALVEAANCKGGPDNVSVCIIEPLASATVSVTALLPYVR